MERASFFAGRGKRWAECLLFGRGILDQGQPSWTLFVRRWQADAYFSRAAIDRSQWKHLGDDQLGSRKDDLDTLFDRETTALCRRSDDYTELLAAEGRCIHASTAERHPDVQLYRMPHSGRTC